MFVVHVFFGEPPVKLQVRDQMLKTIRDNLTWTVAFLSRNVFII